MHVVTVSEAMRPMPASVDADIPLAELAGLFADTGEQALPVVDHRGAMIGVISAEDLEPALADANGGVTAAALARPIPRLRGDDKLDQAARLLAESAEPGLPVLAVEGEAVLGWIGHHEVLCAYSTSARATNGFQRAGGSASS